MNIIKVPFSPLISSRDIFLFSVESKLKYFAFSPKLQNWCFGEGHLFIMY